MLPYFCQLHEPPFANQTSFPWLADQEATALEQQAEAVEHRHYSESQPVYGWAIWTTKTRAEALALVEAKTRKALVKGTWEVEKMTGASKTTQFARLLYSYKGKVAARVDLISNQRKYWAQCKGWKVSIADWA